MLKFHEQILRKIITLFLLLFLIVGVIVYYWTKNFYLNQTQQALLKNIELIALNLHKEKNYDLLAKEIKDNLNFRLTLVDAEGHVLAESSKDKIKMDNHKYRAEIMQANKENFGYRIRHSKTLDEELLYVAKKYTIGEKIIYVRLAVKLEGIYRELVSLAAKIISVIVLFFIIIFVFTYKIQKQVQYEMKKILTFLKELTRKQKPTYIASSYSQEFSQITSYLTKVAQILSKKEKSKLKYTKELQKSNQQKDDIISAISHEFKNPIAVINGYSQTLLEDENINTAIRQKFISKIHNNGLKLNELIDTIRLSIKLDGGTQSLQYITINVPELIADCIDTVKINHPLRTIEVKVHAQLSIKADKSLLYIAISNLLENALKYSEDTVLVHIHKKHLEVVDTGIGIEKKDLENITDKFFRVHNNSWNNSLGLGLFLVNNIVHLHNYKLKIKSKKNEGSTFSILF